MKGICFVNVIPRKMYNFAAQLLQFCSERLTAIFPQQRKESANGLTDLMQFFIVHW